MVHIPAPRGQAREQAAVSGLLERVRTGTGEALLLRAEPGQGTSALLDYAAGHAADMTVLRPARLLGDDHRPLSALRTLLEPIAHHGVRLPAPYAQLLSAVLAGADCPDGQRLLLSTATTRLLAAAATHRPVLCCLDDADRMDPRSLAVLLFVALRLAGTRVAMILTGRPAPDVPLGPDALTRSGLPTVTLRASSPGPAPRPAPLPAPAGGDQRSAADQRTVDSLLATADRFASERPGLALVALIRAGEAITFSGDQARYAELADRCATISRAGADAHVELMHEHIAGFAAALRGDHRSAAGSLRRVVQLAAGLDSLDALTAGSAAGLLLGDSVTVLRLGARAVELARSAGDICALPLVLELTACAEYGAGSYDSATRTAHAGLRAARECGQANYADVHLALLGLLAALQGDRDTALGHLSRLDNHLGRAPVSRPEAYAQWALGVLDLAAGRPADAAIRLASLSDPVGGHGQLIIASMATPWLVEAAAGLRDRAPARLALAAYEQWADSTGNPLHAAIVARCRALLAAGIPTAGSCGNGSVAGDPGASDHFEAALRLHTRSGVDFEDARTELLYGEHLRRCRRPGPAREHLHRAWEIFEHLSLPAWSDRARAQLRATGELVAAPTGSRPALTVGPTDEIAAALTAQQLRIARLVADGATNREVASQLFLSTRTIDHHMRNILRQLGVRSRTELARTLR